MWKLGSSPKDSGPVASFMETATPGSAMCAHSLTKASNSATIASRSILMKVSTKPTMVKSGFSVKDATNGTILTVRLRETTIKLSNKHLLTTLSAPISVCLALKS